MSKFFRSRNQFGMTSIRFKMTSWVLNNTLCGLILTLSSTLYADNVYMVSNGGKQNGTQTSDNTNYMALYDGDVNSSILIGGYKDKTNDNGHCVQGDISGQVLTLIIPENLTSLGLINKKCQTSSSGSSGNKSYTMADEGCAGNVLCDVVVTDGAEVQIIKKDGSTIGKELHVSSVCNSLAEYIKKNIADTSKDKDYKISEYASCDGSKNSYCAIQFVPKGNSSTNSSRVFLRVNTNWLLPSGDKAPSTCDKQSETCYFVNSSTAEVEPKSNAHCGLNILFSSGISNMTDWVQSNFSNIQNESTYLPPSAYFKCDPEPSGQLLDRAYNDYPALIQKKLKQKYASEYSKIYNIAFGTKPKDTTNITNSDIKNAIQKLDALAWSKPNASGAAKEAEKLLAQFKGIDSQVDKVVSKKIATDVQAGIPCVGIISSDQNGKPMIVYECKTMGYQPQDYTCTFMYTAKDSSKCTADNCEMELSSAYCDIPASLVLSTSPFSCGFCGKAETGTVGGNQVSINIETYGTEGELYPFSTQSTQPPICSNGFIAEFKDKL